MTEHIEFIHRTHFDKYYLRQTPVDQLANFIDYFWETGFQPVLTKYPQGFTDILFPNIGYTYLVNLGTPFTMEFSGHKVKIKSDGLLPRHKSLAAHHTEGNKVFGIKFRVSPILFEKKVNFYEYRESIFSLSYLINKNILDSMKQLETFSQRVELLSSYYLPIIRQHKGSMKQIDIVTEILKAYDPHNEKAIEKLAKENNLSPRSILRYFNIATGLSPKKAFQILRLRKAIEAQITQPSLFKPAEYGFYDLSHYQRQLKEFLRHGDKSYYQSYLQSIA